MDIKLLPYQMKFLKSKAMINMMVCGRGVGKSTAIGYKVVQLIAEKKSILAVAPDYKMLKNTLFLAITDALIDCGIPFKYNKTEMLIEVNGCRIYGISGEAYEKARGLTNITALVMDEAAMICEEAIPIFAACLRGAGPPEYYFVSTPRGRTGKAKWFYEYSLRKDSYVIRAHTKDNYLVDPSFYTSMLAIYGNTEFADQELGGDFCTFNAGFLNSKWLKVIKKPRRPLVNICRSYDLAVSTKTSADYTATTLLSHDKYEDTFTIHEIQRFRKEYPDVKKFIMETALKDGPLIPIHIETFGQQISIVQDLKREPLLRKHIIISSRPLGDKLAKAMPFASVMSQGKVSIVEQDINEEVFAEMDEFTGQGESGTHDDMVDSMGIAYFGLVKQVPGKQQDITGLY